MFERVASEMACVHNMIIRGLNSMYLQAPHLKTGEASSFVRYALEWYRLLDVHHSSEEAGFFAAVEEMAGEEGIMAGNVAQHAAFRDGVEEFKAYLDKCVAGGEFDGQRVVKILDSFGHVLVEHLTDEIQTLLDLRRFGAERMTQLEQLFGEEGEKNMASPPLRSREQGLTSNRRNWASSGGCRGAC